VLQQLVSFKEKDRCLNMRAVDGNICTFCVYYILQLWTYIFFIAENKSCLTLYNRRNIWRL